MREISNMDADDKYDLRKGSEKMKKRGERDKERFMSVEACYVV